MEPVYGATEGRDTRYRSRRPRGAASSSGIPATAVTGFTQLRRRADPAEHPTSS
ncbi:hypothetical protein Rhow_004414 [Rhodococcus wratislaviensis]|uniref:Uncharacterized protein n=1 Tax=Rhodococcus wratislaviensis TaxID=44752 RepID=A0A402CB06_RHOWR|nr:hypothetical protein Rhow_004414 [Rhodococcus wratislaviensis]